VPAYYNEIDPYAAQWLRELIKGGHIAPGDVDERDIRNVQPDDLKAYEQCHFFAGIGGWSLALRLAKWPDDRPVWTGSCPCQPFSTAGARKSVADDRHFWPSWFRLIRERKPATIFGEQVANAVGDQWLDAVAHDLEGAAYATGAVILPACAVGAPHKRDRLWFVADANRTELRHEHRRRSWENGQGSTIAGDNGPPQPLAYTNTQGEYALAVDAEMACAPQLGSHAHGARFPLSGKEPDGTNGREERRGAAAGDWWAVEPDVGRVADGISARMGKLRALGNAIVPQVAAQFIMSFDEATN
jgi:DNA (cytosine-5)-methyltransferase 1